MKFNSPDIAKAKRSKVTVTRSNENCANRPRGAVPLMHLRHVPLPPDSVATLVNGLQSRVNSVTLCVTLNANTRKIVLVTLCIQIEWLFYNAFWRETNTKVTLIPSRARGHVPPLLQMTGHGGTESKKKKKARK